jgi:peptidoglycan hydrolase-like protein with peptidoglycan-binding domain
MAGTHPDPNEPPISGGQERVRVDETPQINIDPAVPYYVVLTTNKADYTWAIDPDEERAVSDWSRVDLRRGDDDDKVPFSWVSDLQRDLLSFEYKRVVRQSDGTQGEPDGDFGPTTERAVRCFQIHATIMNAGFGGTVNGRVDDDTKNEIKRWKDRGLTRTLQPFDPRNLLNDANLAPAFRERMRQLGRALDGADLELFGPTGRMDTFRSAAVQARLKASGASNAGYGYSWHNFGLAADMYLYSSFTRGAPGIPAEGWYAGERMAYRNLLVGLGLRWGGEIPGFPAGDYGHTDFANGRTTRHARDAFNARDAQQLSDLERLQRAWGIGQPEVQAP